MYIGTLKEKSAKTNITYTYKKRGLNISYCPDLITETEDKSNYGLSDKLFTDYIGFDGTVLLDRGVDIHLDLGRECFVDSLSFKQGEDSELGFVKVLIPKGGELKPVGSLMPQSSKTITDKEISILVGVFTDKLVLRLNCAYKHIVIGHLDISGAIELENPMFPIPKNYEYTVGYFTGDFMVYASDDDSYFAASNFTEKLNEITKAYYADSPVMSGKKAQATKENNNAKITFSLASMEEEEYKLKVTKDSITLTGGSRRALIYGSERLLQLADENGIRCCEIEDKPFMQIRGVHFALPDRDKIDFFKKIIKYVIAPLGFNNVYIQPSGTMEYKKHPEINTVWADACEKYRRGEYPKPAHYEFVSHDILTQEEVKDICAYIRSFGLEIIPEVQTFGHTQYITMAHPELAEIEPDEDEDVNLFVADIKPKKFYKHCMCPNHPEYYNMTFDIIDEVIDVMKPEKYLHIGHDEIYVVGKCERCKDIPDDEILVTEVTNLNNHIKSKGLTTMMWSDMLQEQHYTTSPAINRVPKDIIYHSFTWYFHLDENIENMLYDNGLKVMHGNFYSSHFPRFNDRKNHPNFMGAQTSTWVNIYEDIFSFKGKFYDIVYDSTMFWNKEYKEDCNLVYGKLADAVLQKIRPHISDSVITGDTQSVDFEKSVYNVPWDILSDYSGAAKVSCGKQLKINVNGKFSKIAFVHATDIGADHIVWETPEPLADYIINYTDGTSYTHAIGYGVGIMEYKRRYAKPLESDLYRHEGYIGTGMLTPYRGKTADGLDYTICEYTIPNPNPEKEILQIMLSHRGTMDSNIILFDIKVQRVTRRVKS